MVEMDCCRNEQCALGGVSSKFPSFRIIFRELCGWVIGCVYDFRYNLWVWVCKYVRIKSDYWGICVQSCVVMHKIILVYVRRYAFARGRHWVRGRRR